MRKTLTVCDCVAFTSEIGRERQKETAIKEVDVYGLVIDFVAPGCIIEAL